MQIIFDPRISEWDNLTVWRIVTHIFFMGANAGNWNILVPVGKENNLMIPLVVASERGVAQTYDVLMRDRGSRVTISYFESEENVLESSII